jgi:hypothetical protein
MVEKYFAGEYHSEALKQLKMTLDSKPFISGSHYGLENKVIIERLVLVFPDGSKEMLGCEGSVYDYMVLCNERYRCKPTKEQIAESIDVKGEEPVRLKYEFDNGEEPQKSLGPIEIPYQEIKKLGWI